SAVPRGWRRNLRSPDGAPARRPRNPGFAHVGIPDYASLHPGYKHSESGAKMPVKNSGEAPPQLGGTAMQIAMFPPAFLRAVLAACLIAIMAGTATAQKRGGSITVGLDLAIPGLDPIKVGVYDTAAAP